VLSRSTEATDRGEKLRIYAREGVMHVWLMDPPRKSLEVLTLDPRRRQWTKTAELEGHDHVRAIRCRRARARRAVDLGVC
jgi:Uma2 family endonuclease